MEFNEHLRYLIDCEEIKIKDLAPKLCLSASTLSNYAQGIREPDYDTLRRIADYFGVSIDYLLGHKTPAEDDERQLLARYRSFTPSQKRLLLDQAELQSKSKRLTRRESAGRFFMGSRLRGVGDAAPYNYPHRATPAAP